MRPAASLGPAAAPPVPGPVQQTRTFRALEHTFAVRSNDAAIARHVEDIFADLTVDEAPGGTYLLADLGTDDTPRFLLRWGDEHLARTVAPGRALSMLQWHVNQRAVSSTTGHLLLHAAAAEWAGGALALPAPMNAGKTTLVAALVDDGFGYLTDETLALDRDTLRVRPYPKPLSIDPGSREVLARLRPDVHASLRTTLEWQWHVPASSIRPGAVVGPTPLRWVVAPRYELGATTRLEPLARAEAVLVLAGQSFDQPLGAGGFRALADVVRQCACSRLVVGDLAAAATMIGHLVRKGPDA